MVDGGIYGGAGPVKEIQEAELVNSKGNCNLVFRLIHKYLHLRNLYKYAEDKEAKAKETAKSRSYGGEYLRKGTELYGLSILSFVEL